MPTNSNNIKFKFVCHSNNNDKWKEGENRLLYPQKFKRFRKNPRWKIYIRICILITLK